MVKMLRFYYIRWFVLFITVSSNIAHGYSQLYINEILASNVTINPDPSYRNYGDWIEIYNAGSSGIDLLDYTITDDINNLEKYRIDYSTYIGAYSYKLIWADKEDNYLHTNFSLDSDGEWIGLISPEGTIVDSITYKKQIPDISYGKQPDGSSNWVYFPEPTPENTNSSTGVTYLIQTPDVSFSISSGFYSSSQSVGLSTSSPTATIHYTTDGSIPTDNSSVYSSPVQISSTTVLKARCYENGLLPGNIGVSTYFINESFDIPVVSLSTDPYYFFNWSWGIYVVGSNGIPGCGHEEPANYFQDWERPVNFEYFETDGDRKVNKMVGTKLVGACSRNWPSKSLTLISREKYGEAGLNHRFFPNKNVSSFKSLTLRNSGNDFGEVMLRDGFMQNLVVGKTDIDCQGYQPAVVFLNGEYWGLLNVREKLNEHYVESNYGIDSDDVSVLENDAYVVYGSADHYSSMLDYINSNDLSIQANFDYVNTQMNIDQYLDYYISNTFFDNEDWPHNNIKYWRENNSTSRWRWMLFDTDFGFGLFDFYDGQNLSNISSSYWSYDVIRELLENQNFENEFIQRFAAHMNTTFEPYRVIGVLDSLAAIIDSKMPRHINKWGHPSSYSRWLEYLEDIRNYAHDRVLEMKSQIVNHFSISGTYNLTTSVSAPGSGTIQLYNVDITNATEGEYFDDIPIRLEAVPEEGYSFVEWTGDISNTSNPVSLTFSSDVYIQANFEETAIVDTFNNIYINEFAANDTWVNDDHGEQEDWIEIYNGNYFAVDIGGLYISDAIDVPLKFQIPKNVSGLTTIPPYGYLVLWADNQTGQGSLHTNFKLDKDGEELCLVHRIEGTNNYLDSIYFTDQYVNTTYGRYPDGSANWSFMIPTPGSTNITSTVTVSGIFINEFSAENDDIIADENGEYDDWIEIYNITDDPIDIGGLFITDSLGDPTKYNIPLTSPDSTTIPAHGYLILWADNQEEQGILHLGFKLGRNGEQIGLIGYNGIDIIDSLTYSEQYSNSSLSRYPDGNDSWIYALPTPGSTNTLPVISGLYINEFSASNTNIITDENGEYDDWIEIYNSTSEPVDIGGLFITDSLDNPTKYRLPVTSPELTTIPAYGYLILWADNQEDQGILHLDFKLGRNGEQIGLVGYDGTDFIDSLTYDELYVNSSLSRYPDANASWVFSPPTPGSTNTLPVISGLFINEFSASNSDIIADENGEHDDWIEIYNSTDYPVDVGGLFMTDSLDDPTKHRIPTTYPDSTTIPAYGYIVLWADNQEDQGVLHLDFNLGRLGEQIGLAGYDGIDYIDSLTYGEQYSNSSISRYPDGDLSWINTHPTPGNANMLPVVSGLYINEFSASNTDIITDEHGEYADWIEIYNSTNEPVNIGGLFVTDSLGDPAKHRIAVTSPDSTTIPPYEYLVLWADDDEEQGVLHLGFNLRRLGEQIGLATFNGADYIDSLTYGEQILNSSSSRYPDGNNIWINSYSTPGSTNSLPFVLSYTIEGTNDLKFTLEEMPGYPAFNVYRENIAFFTPDRAGGTNRIAAGITDEDPVEEGVQWTDIDVVGNANINYFYIFTAVGGSESANSATIGEFDYDLIITSTTDFNEIALALDIEGVTDADELLGVIPECNSVAKWNAAMQGYEQYIPGIPPTNFPVQTGYPYYVNVTDNTVFTLLGEIAEPQFDLVTTSTTDFNEVMLTLDKTDITLASELIADIPSCNSIALWNTELQGYEQYIPGIPPTDFDVKAGYPYYVNVTSDVQWPESAGGGLKSTANYQKPEQSDIKNNAPHIVYGKITSNGEIFDESNINFSAYIDSRPDEKLDNYSAGCMIKDGYWIVQCNTLPSGWVAGDTLKVTFKEINGTLTGEAEAELTYEPADKAGDVVLEEGIINNGLTRLSPNPFNFETILHYQIQKNGKVEIEVYNVAGQRVRSLVNEYKNAGIYEVRWNGRDNYGKRVSDGVYIYIMKSGDFITKMKTVFIK